MKQASWRAPSRPQQVVAGVGWRGHWRPVGDSWCGKLVTLPEGVAACEAAVRGDDAKPTMRGAAGQPDDGQVAGVLDKVRLDGAVDSRAGPCEGEGVTRAGDGPVLDEFWALLLTSCGLVAGKAPHRHGVQRRGGIYQARTIFQQVVGERCKRTGHLNSGRHDEHDAQFVNGPACSQPRCPRRRPCSIAVAELKTRRPACRSGPRARRSRRTRSGRPRRVEHPSDTRKRLGMNSPLHFDV